jgi:hypothetical protein
MSKSPTAWKSTKPDRAATEGAEPVFGEGRVLFLLAAVSALVYANSLGGQFVYDDPKQIVNNPALRSWGNLLRAFTTDVWAFQRAGSIPGDVPPPYYRPLFTAYTSFGYQLFDLGMESALRDERVPARAAEMRAPRTDARHVALTSPRRGMTEIRDG